MFPVLGGVAPILSLVWTPRPCFYSLLPIAGSPFWFEHSECKDWKVKPSQNNEMSGPERISGIPHLMRNEPKVTHFDPESPMEERPTTGPGPAPSSDNPPTQRAVGKKQAKPRPLLSAELAASLPTVWPQPPHPVHCQPFGPGPLASSLPRPRGAPTTGQGPGHKPPGPGAAACLPSVIITLSLWTPPSSGGKASHLPCLPLTIWAHRASDLNFSESQFSTYEVGIIRLTGFRRGHLQTELTHMWPKAQKAAL